MSILGSIIGGIFGLNAADKAADASADASKEATALLREQYNQTREDFTPYRQFGYDAIGGDNGLRTLLGMSSGTSSAGVPGLVSGDPVQNYFAANPDVADAWNSGAGRQYASSAEEFVRLHQQTFPGRPLAPQAGQTTAGQGGTAPNPNGMTEALRSTPGYQFAYDEGMKGVEGSMAARGLGNSGAAQKALFKFGHGIADQTYQQAVNNKFNAANIGMGAAANTSGAGSNFANGAATAALSAGDAQSNAALNRGSVWQGVTNGIFGAIGTSAGAS